MTYDLIIIGSGSVGAAAGYYATRAGLKVLMTDAHMPPHNEGSHHGNTRLIRHAYGEGEKYVPLVLRAQQLWDELNTLTGEAVFERTGVVNFGPADSAFLANVAASAAQWKLALEKLDAASLMARWPEIRVPDDYIALYEPTPAYYTASWRSKAGSSWLNRQAARSSSIARLPPCTIIRMASPLIPRKELLRQKSAGERWHLGENAAANPADSAGAQSVCLVPGRWPLQREK